MCRIGACKEQARSMAGAGQKQELGGAESGKDNDDDDQDYDDEDRSLPREGERDIRLPVGRPT